MPKTKRMARQKPFEKESLTQNILCQDGKMNHKRHRPKNRRAGCLLCKPHKMNGYNDQRIGSATKPNGMIGISVNCYADSDIKEYDRTGK